MYSRTAYIAADRNMANETKLARNFDHLPHISDEGNFRRPLPCPPIGNKNRRWFERLSPHDRMFYHQTLASARRAADFEPILEIPKDSLDLRMSAEYNHEQELFVSKSDVVLQRETLATAYERQTFRRLRNSRDLIPKQIYALGHPLAVGKMSHFKLVIFR